MTKDRIQEFSLEQAEPVWLTDLRLKAFEKVSELDLPVVERVKFHRWNLGDGRLETND
ncbi:MAG TPA: Fe-S cluster assembly protein SufD, partial [Streptococcus sp.]|nr:Fe-S cluster assembly protein SufD [Streptococcus sp.]